MILQQPLAFIKEHFITISIIGAAIAGAASFWVLATAQINREVAAVQQKSRQDIAKTDAAIKVLKEKQAAIAAAAKLAAAEAAEASANATSPADVTPAQAANCNTSSTHSNPSQIDVVVNKKHCMRPINYVPGDLVTVYGATLASVAATQFEALYNAAAGAGLPVRATSSFRSYDNQVSTYAHWVSVNGRAGADTVSARPGYSEHQTGLVLDLAAGGCSLDCFGGTAQYGWMRENAATYGFIERYPAGLTHITGYSPETWHYRYVGSATALDMKARGILTLEQYWGVDGGDYAS